MEKAKSIIGENHDLVDTPLTEVFPVFSLCQKKKEGEKLLDEENHHSDGEAKEKEDPLNQYGFGMIAYRDLIFTMFWLFTICSIIMIPAMNFYSAQGGLDPKGFAARYSLGNFGYSSSQCQSAPFSLHKVQIKCQYGFVGEVNAIGVIPSTVADKTICANTNDISTACPISATLKGTVLANSQSGTDGIFNFIPSDVFTTSTPAAECTDASAKIFISYECWQSSETIAEKHSQASIVASLGVLLVLVYLTVLHYFKRASDLNQMSWDIQTITPGDYTAQMEISPKQYNFFMQQ